MNREREQEKKLIKIIRNRQLEFLGHVKRKEELEEIITTRMLEGKRERETLFNILG